MGIQSMQKNPNMSLVLSTDAKPRLKWTPELHQRFVEAVHQLGGPEKATPKSLMRVIGIPGLTLYHLKSHLQKYRLGKGQQEENCIDNKQDSTDSQSSDGQHPSGSTTDGALKQLNESLQIAQALQVQMEVQRKLHEQIEVQRHLQLRIEAQGKYLQSVLKKAQETLAGYNSSSVGVELAKAELSELVAMVNEGCQSSSLSDLTEVGGSSIKDVEKKKMRNTICSRESSLTSSESFEGKDEKQQMDDTGDTHKSDKISLELLPLMDKQSEDEPSNQASGRKRSGSTISDGYCDEQPLLKKLDAHNQLRNSGKLCRFDLNSQYPNDSDSGSKAIDLNHTELELLK